MRIRAETEQDVEAISELVCDAFRDPGSPRAPVLEVGLVTALRRSDAWLPRFSLVAEANNELIGHSLSTRAHVGNVPVLALGPIAVAAGHRGKGVAKALMTETMELATETGEPLIGLLGDPGYYGRFGFVAASEMGIRPSDPTWGSAFQVRELKGYDPSIRGRFEYAEPFGIVY